MRSSKKLGHPPCGERPNERITLLYEWNGGGDGRPGGEAPTLARRALFTFDDDGARPDEAVGRDRHRVRSRGITRRVYLDAA